MSAIEFAARADREDRRTELPVKIGASLRDRRGGFAPPRRWAGLGALHEVAGGGNGAIDGAVAALFAAGIAARTKGKVLWCIARPDLFAPGLAQAGLAPGPGDLCRGRRRPGGAGLHGGRSTPRGLRGGGRRGCPPVDDGVASAATRRRGDRLDRHRAAALAATDRDRRLRPAHRRGHALAGLTSSATGQVRWREPEAPI